MGRIDVVWSVGIRRRSTRDAHYCFVIIERSNERDIAIARIMSVILLASALFGHFKERSPFATVVHDGSIAALDPRKAPIAIPKGRLICVQKAFWIRDGSHAGIRVFATVWPG